MDTLQYEAVKVAMKQDKEGYILTLRVHPDDVPESLLRDFVGARYQVVMVRLADDETPLNRDNFSEIVKLAGMLPRNPDFRKWLVSEGHIFEDDEDEAVKWIQETCGVKSRKELSTDKVAASRLRHLNQEFQAWKRG
ncbi:MAG: hypothetical protein ACO3QV_07605 [Candidatus Nanopelagicaceae bacterium]